MSGSTTSSLPKTGDRMSFQEFKALNLPETSSLYLVNGIVYDDAEMAEDEFMTKRNYQHAAVESRLCFLLHQWQEKTKFACRIFSGEVGCEAPELSLDVGVHVAVVAKETMDRQGSNPFIQGIPLLAIEILSPSDKKSSIESKIDGYLHAGVPLVWMIDPHFRTVVVYRPREVPEMFASGAKLNGGTTLPELSFQVS